MGILGRIFGTEAAIKEGISMVKDGMDALVYTDEEKAGAAAAQEELQRRISHLAWAQLKQLRWVLEALEVPGDLRALEAMGWSL